LVIEYWNLFGVCILIIGDFIITKGGFMQGTTGASGASMLANFLPIILIFVIFYFMLIRPQQKKQKEYEKMLSELKKNDEVVTNGGVHGTILNIKDTTLTLKIDDNVKIEINKNAIGYVKKSRGGSND
jgi:preprotein translocase subunit YajC